MKIVSVIFVFLVIGILVIVATKWKPKPKKHFSEGILGTSNKLVVQKRPTFLIYTLAFLSIIFFIATCGGFWLIIANPIISEITGSIRSEQVEFIKTVNMVALSLESFLTVVSLSLFLLCLSVSDLLGGKDSIQSE